MKVFFMGTAAFAVPTLKALKTAGIEIAAVVTQPDRPRGRGHSLAPTAVKEAALELGLPLRQPESVKSAEEVEALRALNCDAGVVVAYGQLLSQDLLDLPRLGCLNLHASLLPRWRGAAPVHWAVAEGDENTGVAVQKMVKRLDAGPVLAVETVPVGELDTQALLEVLAPKGAALVVQALKDLESGAARETAQDESKATYAPLLKKEDGIADFSKPARDLIRRCRAFSNQPGFRARLRPGELELRLFGLEAVEAAGQPGAIVGRDKDSWLVACGEGAVRIPEIQAPGKKRMSPAAFERGHALPKGARLV